MKHQFFIGTVSFPSLDAILWMLVWLCTLPAYFFMFVAGVICTLVNSCLFDKHPTQQDVINLLLHTSLFLLVEKDSATGMYVFECNSLLVMEEKQQPYGLQKMKIICSLNDHSIHRFQVNQEEVSDPAVMMGAVSCYFCLSHHTKIHCVSECLMKYITDNKLKELYPSLFFTRALHTGLLYNPMSPMASPSFMPGHLPIGYGSILAETENWASFNHRGLTLFRNNDCVPLCKFFVQAREICFRHTRAVGMRLPSIQEAFFLHTVVHAVDHYLSYKYTKGLHYFQGACFRDLWMRPIVYPLVSNLMKTLPSTSVYNKIYVDLNAMTATAMDKELANCVTASIMY